MGILDTFSKRQKKLATQGQQDVYQYDVLPEPFRVQVIHIWRDAIGIFYVPHDYTGRPESPANELWTSIHNKLARERGVFVLGDGQSYPSDQCKQFLLRADTPGALDIIEFSFRVIDRWVRKFNPGEIQLANIKQDPDDAIKELNHRFQEHSIGYQYVDGYLVRVDSQFVHAEVVKPALSLLNDAGFRGPAEEFMRSFDHYRKRNYKEAVSEALKAFESTMKAICSARKWNYPTNATARPLIDILMKNGLVPVDLETHFGGLRAAMESGLPTISNRTSRHGQGPEPVAIPPHFAAYALHMAASNIVFLVEAHKAAK
jgi:hypothetical protein